MNLPKLRAWDKDSQKMNGNVEIYINKDKTIEVRPKDNKTIVMQSTGLLDKNGKEIFEGDVVKVLNSLYTVFYDSERGSFRLRPHDKRWHTDYMSNFSGGGNFEIIGNIYEGVIDDNN